MDPHEGAVPIPQVEIVIDCGARRQVLRDRPPLAASAQHVKQRIDDFPQVHPALVAAAFGRRNERSNKSPFLVRQITGIPQIAAVIATAVFVGPHRPVPIESLHAIESQPIHLIQHVAGQALRTEREVIESLDRAETLDDGWLLHFCSLPETASMIESAIWRSWFLRRVRQLAPLSDRERWASRLWGHRHRLVQGPIRTLRVNRASSGTNAYIKGRSEASFGAFTIRGSAQKALGFIGDRHLVDKIIKRRAGVIIVPDANRLGRAAYEGVRDAFALSGVGVRLLSEDEGKAHCANPYDDGELHGLIVAPRRLAGYCGIPVCDSMIIHRPPGVRPTLIAVGGYDRPLALLAFILAAVFPNEVIELRCGSEGRRASVQIADRRYPADLDGLERAGGDQAALRLARHASKRAKEAKLDAASVRLLQSYEPHEKEEEEIVPYRGCRLFGIDDDPGPFAM
jgi:hypothetical protein